MIHGIGTDIIEITRIDRVYQKHSIVFVDKILSPIERECYPNISAVLLAKRFAAKEAISKALGYGIGGQLSWHDIIITHNAVGQPQVTLPNHHAYTVHLSISDTELYVVAFALAVRI